MGTRARRVRRRVTPRRARSRRGWVVLAGLVALVLLGAYLVVRQGREVPVPAAAAETAAPVPEPIRRDAPAATADSLARRAADAPALDAPVPIAPVDRPAFVAIVIDDLGRRVEDVEALAGLGIDLSYAVLPFEARTAEVVERLRGRSAEILLHLPMEPDGSADPGPGALRRGMDAGELARHTSAALDAVPGAVGVNNHMGSALSADDAAMAVILDEIRARDLFFLDSRTSAGSVGFDLARRRGLAAVSRDVFLDGVLEPEAIRSQFRKLLEVAREQGAAVAIGHPHSETLAVLRDEVPRARTLGYRFVPVSYLLERTGGE